MEVAYSISNGDDNIGQRNDCPGLRIQLQARVVETYAVYRHKITILKHASDTTRRMLQSYHLGNTVY